MPHIVAPDVGTAATLFAAAAHPDRIASLIVGTGGAAVPIQLGEPLASWVLDPDLDKYRKMDPRVIVGVALDTIAGGIPDDIRADCRPATTATASPNRCATSASIPRNCPC
jgi:pimeloyl-ACP methyl ester carboxylesterase